jgi:flagellar biogenesis protein FliO
MLTSLTLLAVIAGDGSFVDAARASLAGADMEVSIETSGPVEAGDVRTKLHGRHLVVYIDGALVRPDRTHLGTAERPIAGFLRGNYAKLEIPFPADKNCAGPIAVRTQAEGLSARIACEDASPTGASPTSASTRSAAAASPPAPRAANRGLPATAAPSPALLIAKPAASVPGPGAAKPEPAVAEPRPSPRSLTPIVAVLLVLVAGAGALVWSRGRVRLDKQIRIIETASLGPKRSLILAEVGGAALVIGASEAGITLLSTTAAPAPAISFATNQSSELARLFGGRTSAPPGDDATFESIFDESFEDLELRQRLTSNSS